MKQSIRTFIITLPLLLASTSLLAGNQLDEAELLIKQGKGEQAYDLLMQTFEQNVGDPDYDYLFGLAAMDAGHPTAAVFAFERILDVNPNHAEARIELARAYYQLNEYRAAQQEFETVREDVPVAVQSTIDKFLTAIKFASAPAQKKFEAYVQAGFGYDSNVNGAKSSSDLFVPLLGVNFLLDDNSVEKDSPVFAVDAGLSFEKPTDTNTSIYGRLNFNGREPWQERQFSTKTISAALGLLTFIDSNQLRVGLLGQRYLVDDSINSNLVGIEGSLQHTINSLTRITLLGKYTGTRYPSQNTRNVNTFSGGVSLTRAFEAQGNPVVFASLTGGNDEEQDDSRPDLGREFYSISTGGLYTVSPDVTAIVGLSFQHSHYGAKSPLFTTTRSDDLLSASAGLIIDWKKNWDIRPVIKYTDNDSTLALNEFSRWQAFVNVRRTF